MAIILWKIAIPILTILIFHISKTKWTYSSQNLQVRSRPNVVRPLFTL